MATTTPRTDASGNVVTAPPAGRIVLDHLLDVENHARRITSAKYRKPLVDALAKARHDLSGDQAALDAIQQLADQGIDALKPFRVRIAVGSSNPKDTVKVLASHGWIESPIAVTDRVTKWRVAIGSDIT